jgi:asparagine synthase (glutamine-hydrolysing)
MLEQHAEEAASEWLSNTDQPSIDGLNTFIISRAVRGQGIKVALSGLGADELFGGYPSFTEVPRIAPLAKWFQRLPRALQGLIAKVVRNRKAETGEKLMDMLTSSLSVAAMALQRRRLMNNRQMNLLGFKPSSEDQASLWLPADALAKVSGQIPAPGWTISKMECLFYQGNTLLRDSDSNSMANSLEIRVPFLDQRMLNWVPSLPDAIRFPRSGPSKFLLRQAGKQYLDRVHLRRPKSGFALPLHRWMVGPLANLCNECLAALKSSSLVKAEGVQTIWDGFKKNPTLEASSRALSLVSLGAAVRFQKS